MISSKLKIIAGSILGAAVSLTVLTLLFTGPRMRVQVSLRPFETRTQDPPDDIIPFDTLAFDPGAYSFPQATSENIARGRVYYNYYCVFCHGVKGDGEGEAGKSYVPRPSDLTVDSIQYLSFQELYTRSFTGTGHSPVLERVVPNAHRPYILGFVRDGL